MKKYIKLLPIFIILGFLMLFFLPSVKGFNDLNFVFQKDTLYTNSNVNNEFYDTFNMKNQIYYDIGNYPATYSFTNDTNGVAPINWSVYELGGSISVISNLGGHNKILDFNDTSGNYVSASQVFTNGLRTKGTIEFWFRSDNTAKLFQILLRDNSAQQNVNMIIDDDKIQYYHTGGWNDATGGGVVDNTWYHVKIVFDCNPDTYDFWLNGVELDTDIPFAIVATSIKDIRLKSSTSDGVYHYYFDAIDYSWSKKVWYEKDLLDFSDDIVGNEPIGWISDNTGICTTIIKDTLDGRSNVLELYDEGGGGSTADIDTDFDITAQISIQTDFAKTEMAGGGLKCGFYENEVNIVQIGLFDNDLQWKDDIGWDVVKANVISDSVFIVINIILNFDTDTFDLYIDGILEGNDLGFRAEGNSEVDNIRFFTDDIEVSEFYGYIDNIYIDGIIYTNMIPLTIETDYLEVDKYEFALKDVNTFNEIGSSSANSWTEMENGYNHTYLAQDLTPPNNPYVSDPPYPIGSAEDNRVFQVIGNGTTHELTGIQKTNIGIENGIFDVSFCINATQLDNSHGGMKFYIYSYSTWLNTGIWINWTTGNNGAIYAYGAGGTWTLLNNIGASTLTVNDKIDFKVHIGSFNYLEVYDNDVLVGSYSFPLVDNTEKGLNLIQIYSEVKIDAENDNIINIHNVGVYLNGLSICTEEVGRVMLDTNDGRWDSKQHYSFFIQGNGNFIPGMARTVYYVSTPIYQNITDNFQEYDSTIVHYNTFDRTYVIFSNSTIIFHILGSNFSISSINIEGVKLVQNTNEYSIIFTHGGVNINENYFFVDSSNNLRFIHTTNQDDILEFIQAEFVIQNKSSTDTAVSIHSSIDNNAYGFFRVKFATTSLIIQIENILNTKRVLLESNKTIDSFIILITDTNKNYIEGITEGLITNIKLFDIETSIASVVSLNLIDMIIPLIIILLPTLSISKLYGDFLIIPLFLMFSLILAITTLIPIWLFFVILVSSSLFIFFEKNKKMVF